MGKHTIVFNEDLDLNAAVGQLAAAKNQLNCTLYDADTIQLPNEEGMYITDIFAADETAAGTGGYLELLGKSAERKFRYGQIAEVGDKLITHCHFQPGQFMLDKGQKIKAFGNISGTGAEQHTICIDVFIPSIPEPTIYNGPCKGVVQLGLKTGTLTAQTISGFSRLTGDVTAYEDTESQYGVDPSNKYVLMGFYAAPGGAGYGALGVRHSSAKFDIIRPAIFANAIMADFYELNWAYTGESPHKLVGCGVGTTSTEETVRIGEIT